MALNAEYFDSIYIDVVKKKYYNAKKVQAVFEDIRRQAEELNAENSLLRRQLAQQAEELNAENEALGQQLARQAEELNAENETLRQQLAALQDRRVELGDALLSAQSVYCDIVERGKARAETMTRDAERRSAAMLAEARHKSEQMLADSNRQQEYAVQRVEGAFNRMKQLHMASIDALNAEWQDFLCGLYPDAETLSAAEQGRNYPAKPEDRGEDPPADLEQKVSDIARKVFSLEDGE
jgi:cell division septum initiation protein DivIVA